MRIIIIFVLLFNWCDSSQNEESQFIVPTLIGTNVEYYDMDRIRFAIFLDKVNFEEAAQMCSSWNGTLLTLKGKKIGEFISQALGESAVGVTSLWIGGEYTPAKNSTPGVWKWKSGENINKKPIPKGYNFPMTVPPYWVDRPDLNSTERACLVMDRNRHQRPLITGLPCNVKRPFICTLAATDEIKDPVETNEPVNIKEKTYHIFEAHSTWSEALSFCRTLGYKLAVVTKPEEFKKLKRRMVRHRPVLENAWIGGEFVNGKWMWVSTNEEIGSKNTTDGKTFSPPWYRPGHITMDGCLLADRHVCDYFAYVEAKCDRKRNFVCESDLKKEDIKPLLNVPPSKLFVSNIKLGWLEAKDMCAFCLNGSLLQLDYHNVTALTQVVDWLFKAMTQWVGTELRHVWVGGYLYGIQFTWGENISNPIENARVDLNSNKNSSHLKYNGDNGLIIFCPGNFDFDPNLRNFKCLNMDRENQKTFFMYGLDCSHKQHFVCMTKDERSPDTPFPKACNQHYTITRWNKRTAPASTTKA